MNENWRNIKNWYKWSSAQPVGVLRREQEKKKKKKGEGINKEIEQGNCP